MTKVLIPLAEGCEELEAVTLIDVLRRAGIEVITASLNKQQTVTASRGVKLIADVALENVLHDEFDMIILPGGMPGTHHLNNDARIHDLLHRFNTQKKPIAAICAAPLVLAHTGLLDYKSVSCYPGAISTSEWPSISLSDDAVVISGNILTSQGPGTAMIFALEIIEYLTDKTTRQQVETGLMPV